VDVQLPRGLAIDRLQKCAELRRVAAFLELRYRLALAGSKGRPPRPLVDGERHRALRRVEVESYEVRHLADELGPRIAAERLGGPTGLELVRLPDPLHRCVADPHVLREAARRPVRRVRGLPPERGPNDRL